MSLVLRDMNQEGWIINLEGDQEGPKAEKLEPSTLDTSKPITLDFLTNPDKK